MMDGYILKQKEVMAVKIEDNDTSLDQIMNLLGDHCVGFVYKEGEKAYCSIKWNVEEPPIYANIGDWVIKKHNNTFEVWKNDTFKEKFDALFVIAKAKKEEGSKKSFFKRLFNRGVYSLLNILIYLIILYY